MPANFMIQVHECPRQPATVFVSFASFVVISNRDTWAGKGDSGADNKKRNTSAEVQQRQDSTEDRKAREVNPM